LRDHHLLTEGRWGRARDLALAATLASWAVGLAFGLGRGEVATIPLGARLAMAAVHATSAWLFATRAPALAHGDVRAVGAALPSLLLSGLAFRMGATSLGGATLVVFALGAAGTCGALLALGPSFAIFAARRGLVVRGPYRLVRHPAYASELVMIAAAALAGAGREHAGLPGWLAASLVLGATVGATVLRIVEEERLLSDDPAHAAYRAAVRWRLVPGLW
jgi:protein-S-isoprenylcysteine O-methyltransferase Ste14